MHMANASDEENPGAFALELPDGTVRENAKGYSGLATAHFANGDVYKGEYLDGLRHGEGVYTYSNGNTFDGRFERGKKTGLGRLHYAEGGFFHGYYKNNVRCGEGTRRYANGDVYYGQWLDGKRHGHGVYSYSVTKYKLKGTWANGSLVEGSWVLVDGMRYEGKFQFNKPSGSGTWFFPSGTRVEGVYSQRVMPVDDTPDDDPVPAQQVELKWTSTAAA